MLKYNFFLKKSTLLKFNLYSGNKNDKVLDCTHTPLVSNKILCFMSEKLLSCLAVPSPSLRDLLLRKPRYFWPAKMSKVPKC